MSIPGSGAVTLPAELVEFVESGASVLVGTRDARLRPEVLRGAGCIVAKDRKVLSVLLAEMPARRTIANLEAGSPMAVTFSRIVDHRSVQVKGTCGRVRPAGPVEQEAVRRYLAAFTEAVYFIGVSRAIARRMRVEPCVVAELEVRELFEQTPGPGAGARLGARP
jgi:hypothetical protein